MTTVHVRWSSRVLSVLARCVGPMVVLLVFPGATTLTAHADPADVDAKFLAALKSQGITYAAPKVMIAAGHLACAELDRGETPRQVGHDIMNNKDVLTGSNLDAFHAGFFVGASIKAYCPKYAGWT